MTLFEFVALDTGYPRYVHMELILRTMD